VALVSCPECEQQISTLAVACPHCGFPLSGEAALAAAPRRRRGPARWTDPGFWIILVALITVIVMSILILRHAENGWAPETTVPATITGAPVWIDLPLLPSARPAA